MCDYSACAYWDARYAVDCEPFEWYQPVHVLRPYIAPFMQQPALPAIGCLSSSAAKPGVRSRAPPSGSSSPSSPAAAPAPAPRGDLSPTVSPLTAAQSIVHRALLEHRKQHPAEGAAEHGPLRVLVLGCGTSELAAEVWRMGQGRAEVLAMDLSVQCVEEMSRRYKELAGLRFVVGDVRQLELPSGHFDLALDKGCLDCMHCDAAPSAMDGLKRAIAGVQRVLKLHGTLLSLSHSPPDQRIQSFLLDALDLWKDAISQDRKDKDKEKLRRRAQAEKHEAAAGSQHQQDTLGAARPTGQQLPNRRLPTSLGMAQVALLRPTAAFSPPVVHRLSKAAARASCSSASSLPLLDSEDPESALGLRSMEESSHYLYVLRKEMRVPQQPASTSQRSSLILSSSSSSGSGRSSLTRNTGGRPSPSQSPPLVPAVPVPVS